MMRSTFFLFSVLILSVFIAGCDEGDKKKPLGAPCDQITKCTGVCNLGMPDGMCVVPCDEATPCKKGQCIDFGSASYCLPSCNVNTDCRDGYTCWSGHCRPLASLGEFCEEVDDCLPCALDRTCPDGELVDCREGICTIACGNGINCPESTYCGYSTDSYWCVPVDFDTGPGGPGDSCANNSCADGYDCYSAYSGDVRAFCTQSCTGRRDCPPDMTCRDPGDGNPICMPRNFCETCDMDIQCGYQTDRCVATNPANEEGGRYCSRLCDPDRGGTCPVDSRCLQAYFCESQGAWVADCSWCDGSCEPGNSPTYQCFHDYGSCIGEGELCAPCQINSECTEGLCLSMRGVDNTVCSAPCDRNTFCPDGYLCAQVSAGNYQCMPRSGSCTKPSNGIDTCRQCSEWADCLRGVCLPPDGNMNNPSYCLDSCIDSNDCDPYSSCVTLTIYGQYNFKVCRPTTTVGTCSNWVNCTTQCPDGPETCTSGPAYCQ